MPSPTAVNRWRKTAEVTPLALAMAIVLSSCFTAEQNEVASRVNHSRTYRNMHRWGRSSS